MTDRCQIPVELRKRIGPVGISKQKCQKLANSCWVEENNPNQPNCYQAKKGLLSRVDPCQGLKASSRDIGEECYQSLWSQAGCRQKPPIYNDTKKGLSYRQVQKEVKHYATSDDKYHFNMCYGGDIQTSDPSDSSKTSEIRPMNKISYCATNLPPTCQTTLNKEAQIVSCPKCQKYRSEDGGKWLVKNGKRTKITGCICPAAVRAAKLSEVIGNNICDTRVPVPKPIKRYTPSKQQCLAAKEKCETSEDCCPGRLCRLGDQRCLTDNEFHKLHDNKKGVDSTVLSRFPINANINNIHFQTIHYGDKITLRNVAGQTNNYLASCGYDNTCPTNQGASTYTQKTGDYIQKHPTTGQWMILDVNWTTNSGKVVKYGDIILLKNVFSGYFLDTCGLSNCGASSLYQVSTCPLHKAQTTDKIAVRWKILPPNHNKKSGDVVHQGDMVQVLNNFNNTSYLNSCSYQKNCGQGQLFGVNTCHLGSHDSKHTTSRWMVGLDYQDYLVDQKNYRLKTSTGRYLDVSGGMVNLVSQKDEPIAWQLVETSKTPKTYTLRNNWMCGVDKDDDSSCGGGLVATTKSLSLTKNEATPLEFIQVSNGGFLIRNGDHYLGLSGGHPILTIPSLGEIWQLEEAFLTMEEVLAQYQSRQHTSDCQLFAALDNPEVKWFYAGKDRVKGINYSDGEIFYTTEDNIVIIPEGYCQAKCGSRQINLCQQLNSKIKNCRANPEECGKATSLFKETSSPVKEIEPSCFYHLPVEMGDKLEKGNTGITSINCQKSNIFNPRVIDAGVALPNYLDLFKDDLVYRMKWHQDFWSITEGFPKKISKVYRGLSGPVDACLPQYLTMGSSHHLEAVIFFKGSRYYKYRLQAGKVTSQGKISSIFSNVPDNIDAVIPSVWQDGKAVTPTYFIKETKCYRLNLDRLVWGPSEKIQRKNPDDYLLFLGDGVTTYNLHSQLAGQQLAKRLGGHLASQRDLEDVLSRKKPHIYRKYAGWTSSQSEKTYYVAEGSNKLVICGTGNCEGKGGAWCYLKPSQIVLGGVADELSLTEVFPGLPIYPDGLVSLYNPKLNSINYIFRGPELFTFNLGQKRVKLQPAKRMEHLFVGLPPFQDKLKQINKQMCQAQFGHQERLDRLENQYNDDKKVLSKGYDLILKIQRNLKMQAQNMFSNNKTLAETEKTITTGTRQSENTDQAAYRRNSWLWLLKAFLTMGLILLALSIFDRMTGHRFLGKRVILIIMAVFLIILLVTGFYRFRDFWRSSSNRLGKIDWDADLEGEEAKTDLDICQDFRNQRAENSNGNKDEEYLKYEGKTVLQDGVEWLQETETLNTLYEAKKQCSATSTCDGIVKAGDNTRFRLFRLKGSVENVTISRPGTMIFLKKSSQYRYL